jgi:hypothetical protein
MSERKCTVRVAPPNEITRTREKIDRDGNVIETKVEKPKKPEQKK